jgi:hypothetical protein
MVRKLFAVVAGLAVAAILVMLIQKLGHSLYPPPADLDPADEEFMRDYVATLPWGPLAFVLASYIIATLAGGWTAVKTAGESPLVFAGIVGLFVLTGAIMTVVAVPHPTWFIGTAIGGIFVAVLVAAKMASKGTVMARAV